MCTAFRVYGLACGPLNKKTPAVATDRLLCAPPCVCTALCVNCGIPHTPPRAFPPYVPPVPPSCIPPVPPLYPPRTSPPYLPPVPTPRTPRSPPLTLAEAWGLAYIREAVGGQSGRRDWGFGALLKSERQFEAILAGESRIQGLFLGYWPPFVCTAMCL